MYTRSATLGHSVNTVNAQAGKFFNKIGDLIQGSMASNFNIMQGCLLVPAEKEMITGWNVTGDHSVKQNKRNATHIQSYDI